MVKMTMVVRQQLEVFVQLGLIVVQAEVVVGWDGCCERTTMMMMMMMMLIIRNVNNVVVGISGQTLIIRKYVKIQKGRGDIRKMRPHFKNNDNNHRNKNIIFIIIIIMIEST